MAATIRPRTLDDVNAFHAALDNVCRERRHLAMLQAPPLERVRGFVVAMLECDDAQFIAETHDRIVGWCEVRSGHPVTGDAHIGRLGMGVLKEHRRRGIGRRLVGVALRKARSKALEKIELRVYASNLPALTLYQDLGFVEEGRKRRSRLVDGVYDDVIEMALFL